jgi:hypothetical protein
MEFDPRLDAAQKRLGVLIQHEVNEQRMTLRTIQKVQSLCNEFSVTCRLKGIDFPKLVVLPLPSLAHLVIWPAEATYLDVQIRVKQLVSSLRRIGKEIEVKELANAIRSAYPDYGPTMGLYIEDLHVKSSFHAQN